jgi:hypothetical protein
MKLFLRNLLVVICLTFLSGVVASNAQNSAPENKSADKNFAELVLAKRQNSRLMLITLEQSAKASQEELNNLLSAQGPCDTAVSLNTGQSVNAQLSSSDCRLDDGSYADFYAFNGTQGQQITVSMNSNAFDTYLGLANEDGSFVREDDDGGGGTNSRIVATLPASGLYIILANSVYPNQFGDYALSLTDTTPCTFTLEPNSASIPAAGGAFSFRVNTQPGCQWSAYTTDYYFLSSSSAGTGSGIVEYTATVSTSDTNRTGRILVGGQVFTVTQPPLVCSYSISQTSVTMPATGGSGTFTVTAPEGCPWTATASDYFLWADNYGRGTSTIRYTAATNNGADRVGKITVNGLVFTVTQPGLNCTFEVSPTNISVDRFEHWGTITVTTQPGCAWSALGGGFTTVQNAVGTGSGSFSYQIVANHLFGSRTNVIGFYGLGLIRIYVNQTGFPSRTQFDFDADGRADYAVFRPDNGVWYLNQSNAGFSAVSFGLASDKLVPADYDGDRKTDVAVYRGGVWYLLKSRDGFTAVSFGLPEDIPQPADFNGDGIAELAVYRPSNGVWYTFNLVNNQFNAVSFGTTGDKPVVGDYDGDGRADYAVYRPSNGFWYLLRSSAGFGSFAFGIASDKPVPADYDGDGKTDAAVFREGVWHILRSNQGYTGIQFGIPTDIPAPADYDGDGKADVGVYRKGVWHVLWSGTQLAASAGFGNETDKPVSNTFVP